MPPRSLWNVTGGLSSAGEGTRQATSVAWTGGATVVPRCAHVAKPCRSCDRAGRSPQLVHSGPRMRAGVPDRRPGSARRLEEIALQWSGSGSDLLLRHVRPPAPNLAVRG